MTDEQHAYWLDYIRNLAFSLGLHHWRIQLLREPAGDGLAADIRIVRGRRIADIRFADNWMTMGFTEQRQMIVHELLHIWFDPIIINVEAASVAMPHAAFKVLDHTTRMQSEYAVDAIAAAIAGWYPLPNDGPEIVVTSPLPPNQT